MKLSVPRKPNIDLTFVLEGGGLVLYYDANVLRTIEYEEFYPDVGGQAFVVWERAVKHEKFTGQEIMLNEAPFLSPFKYDVRNVEALDFLGVNPEANPAHTLALLRRKWYNKRPRNMDRPAVRQLARNRVEQYLRPKDVRPEEN